MTLGPNKELLNPYFLMTTDPQIADRSILTSQLALSTALSAEFSSHKIDMSSAINMIMTGLWKIQTLFCYINWQNLDAVFQSADQVLAEEDKSSLSGNSVLWHFKA